MICKPNEAPYCTVLTNLMMFSFSCYGEVVPLDLVFKIAPSSVRWIIYE
jgi:hypothetical protein